MLTCRVLAPLALIAATATAALAVSREGQWSERFMPMGLQHDYDDGNAQCLGSWSNYLVVGGWFEQAGSVAAERVAAWDGTRWRGFDGGPNGQVEAIFDHGTELVIGGNFSAVGGETRRYAARYDGVTGQWYGMGNVGGVVRDFVERFGKVYAVGSFENPDPYAPPYTPLAYWQGGAWHYEPVYGWHLWDRPYASAVVDTSFIIGGEIQFGSCYGLIKWDGSGTVGYNLDATVLAIEDPGYGAYIGGWFTTAGGESSPGLVFMNGEHNLFPIAPPPTEFYAQSLTHHGDIIYCADDYEVRYYLPSSGWSAPLGGTFEEAILDLHYFAGELYAAGNMPNGVVRWDDGEWVALAGGIGTAHSHPELRCLAEYDGDIYVGGLYGLPRVTVEQPTGAGIGRWDGDAWHRVDGGVDEEVRAMCVFQGDLWVGGNFHRAGDLTTSNLARFDGETWHDVGGANGRVDCLTIHDGELIAGGVFTGIGGIPAQSLAAFDGTTWRALASTINGAVLALASLHGDLIAAGYINTVNGQAVNHIARWDGAQWHAMDGGMNNSVQALTQWHGELYAGGLFTTAGGVPAPRLAHWDGSHWLDVGAGVAGDGLIYGVDALVGTTTDLFVGGDFATAGGTAIHALASWDGSQWSEFGGSLTACESRSPVVRDLLVVDGDLWVLGEFWEAGGTPSCGIARWIDGTLVPTFLRGFEVRTEGNAVIARWSTSQPADVADFRLEARSGVLVWTIPCVDDRGDYSARDVSPQLFASAGREIVYALQRRENSGHWAVLAERTIALPPPAAGLHLVACPNPFNPRVEIAFELQSPGPATLAVYALDGRCVATVFAGDLTAGAHTRFWDGRDSRGVPAAAGAYVLRLATGDAVTSREVMLVR